MKRIFALVSGITLALALVMPLAACAGFSSLSGVNDDTGMHVVAEGGASGTQEGVVTSDETQGIVINHTVQRGSFHVTLTDADGTVCFEKDVTDSIADLVDVQGEFTVTVEAKSATGTVDAIAYDKEAQAASEATLDEALVQATGKDAQEWGLAASSAADTEASAA